MIKDFFTIFLIALVIIIAIVLPVIPLILAMVFTPYWLLLEFIAIPTFIAFIYTLINNWRGL